MSHSKNSHRGSKHRPPGLELWGKPSKLVVSARNGNTPCSAEKTLERRIIRKREKVVIAKEVREYEDLRLDDYFTHDQAMWLASDQDTDRFYEAFEERS